VKKWNDIEGSSKITLFKAMMKIIGQEKLIVCLSSDYKLVI